jgi:hydrogenase nickel incorporation protein HypB
MAIDNVRFINLKESILSTNENLAAELKAELKKKNTFMINLMSSPGAGKTTFIIDTIRRLKGKIKFGVIEGDVESQVDADKIIAEGVPAVQLRTGGICHLDASMIKLGLDSLDLEKLDLVLVENIGNLICTAEFDLGANLQVMILSVPEGDDKVIKYPLMFSISDVLIVSKIDYISISDFNMEALIDKVTRMNPDIKIFQVSAKNGRGMDEWCDWLVSKIK